jgi:osmotically-inducible protein OsmY
MNQPLRAAIVAAFASLALAACDREAGSSAERNGATVGQKIDQALDRTQQKLAVAGEKTQQKLSEVGEKTQQHLAAAGDSISAATDRAVTNTKEAASDVKNATLERSDAARAPDGATDARGTLSDTAITASVKTDFLKDPDLSVLKIDVDTRNGVVVLNGLADNEPARQRAEKMASAVKGVKEVRNFLTVKRS